MRILTALTGIAALFVAQAFAQAPNQAGANLPTQSVGANDLIAISVYGSPELTRTVRVGTDGLIRLPMIKERIKAAGRYPVDLEDAISKALVNENILVDPIVTVTIAEYQSRPISVAGAVKTPLVFQATQTVTLLEAVARAGGLSPDAGNDILVSTTHLGDDGKPATLTRRVPIKALMDNSDPALNFPLTGGEEVRVPEAPKDMIYVVGNVKKPGAFVLKQDEEETTVMKMLAMAEGLMPFALKEAYIYRRDGANGKNEIPVPLEKIMARKSPDVPLLANDILYIPDNKSKRVTSQTIDRIISFGAGTASGLLIYRR